MSEIVTCRYCHRVIRYEGGVWIDPAATGDDSIWRETCDEHDTFEAEHEPEPEPEPEEIDPAPYAVHRGVSQ